MLTKLTITATATAGGSITPLGSVTVVYGADQSFTIAPDTGYRVSDVEVDGTSIGAWDSYTFTNVTEDHTISASFAIITYTTITASTSSGGTISPSGAVSVSYGADQTFTISPNTGYNVSDVKVDGSSIGSETSYTFTNVIDDHTIHATFALNTCIIEGKVTQDGTGIENVLMNGFPDDLWTDADGYFSYTVDYGWSGTVTPEKHGYGFEPTFRNYPNVIIDQPDQNFATTTIPLVDLGLGNGRRGDKATIPIIFTPAEGTDVSAVSVDIGYDPSVVENPSASIGAAAKAANKNLATNVLSPGVFRVSIFSASNNNTIGIGIIAYLEFNIRVDAPFVPTMLTNTPSASDPSADPVLVGGSNGTVNVTEYAAGDCDENGSVTIDEVQNTANMFAKITPVEDCVDVSGNGKISISEVQKVINNHLMVTAEGEPHFLRTALADMETFIGNGIPALNIMRVYGQAGETVRVPITLNNASGYEISAVSVDISYDTDVLEYSEAEIGPAGSAAEKDVVFSEISPGILRVGVWGINQNVIDDGIVAYVSFDINPDAINGRTILKNTPSASDPSGNDVPIDGTDGTVSVNMAKAMPWLFLLMSDD